MPKKKIGIKENDHNKCVKNKTVNHLRGGKEMYLNIIGLFMKQIHKKPLKFYIKSKENNFFIGMKFAFK